MYDKRIIAAVRAEKDFKAALLSDANLLFDLSPDINTLYQKAKSAHKHGKKLYIHIDLAVGIGKDREAIEFIKKFEVDGIISTRVNIIKYAREAGFNTVQRFFAVDSQSVETTVESIKASKPDMIEIMPGVIPKVISLLKSRVDMPIIAGGLISTEDEAKTAIESGAWAVSTGKTDLWGLEI
jgi:glycerol uptake operon antiterminator